MMEKLTYDTHYPGINSSQRHSLASKLGSRFIRLSELVVNIFQPAETTIL